MYTDYRTSIYRLHFERNKKKLQLLIEESDKTACHYGHLWLHLYTVFILYWPKLHPVLSSMSARGGGGGGGGGFENNKIMRTCL